MFRFPNDNIQLPKPPQHPPPPKHSIDAILANMRSNLSPPPTTTSPQSPSTTTAKKTLMRSKVEKPSESDEKEALIKENDALKIKIKQLEKKEEIIRRLSSR